jgi:NAD+ kinase
MATWKRIGIAAKPGHPRTAELLRRTLALLGANDVEVLLDEAAAAEVDGAADVRVLPQDRVVAESDLIVVLGGDGTVLAVARAIGDRPTPILGVNLGRLGFLTDVAPEEAEEVIASALAGECPIVERSRLQITHTRNGAITTEVVLNDAVLTKGTALARMIELEVSIEGARVADYRSDGLIVATPTGSTAYNLSAGGPLLDPELAAMVLTPICPHTLTQRPLVLPDRHAIEVRLLSDEEIALTLDGQVARTVGPNDHLRITRAEHAVRFVHSADTNNFETLRTKLNWGAQ